LAPQWLGGIGRLWNCVTETERKIDRAAERAAHLAAWYASWSGEAAPDLRAVAGDASFRRYYRVKTATGSLILCDAPPETEKNAEFVTIAKAMAAAGLRVPQVLQADLEGGFLALEDMGDQLLLPLLNDQTAGAFYPQALEMLQALALARPDDFSLLSYDRAHLAREMRLFPEWFCEKLLGREPDRVGEAVFSVLEQTLCDRALAQPQVVVHRDFHARNLMVLDEGILATIDFQDAVLGPISYDPVSLLKDCYLRWPDQQVRDWALGHYRGLVERGVAMPTAEAFLKDFDFMGLQRHIKVLGIFARLYLRDAKPGYLADLPRVAGYVRSALANYPQEPALADFSRWFEASVVPLMQAQEWFTRA
jgi:aminoglycoside/choline kinase family phosphotransferase